MRRSRKAFSLVELVVVIGIIAILIALLFPSLVRARHSARVVACASNLHQIGIALQSYLVNNHNVAFWRGQNLDHDGMDWYAYGGRETGNANHVEDDYFNRIIPRPLNRYVGGSINVFHDPNDDFASWTDDPQNTPYPAPTEFEWVGNSYNFNANGYPFRPQPRHDGGLDAVQFSTIRDTSHTIVLYEACFCWGYQWHYARKGNIAFADMHVEFIHFPNMDSGYIWDAPQTEAQ